MSKMIQTINGVECVNMAGIVMLSIGATLDPDVPKHGKARAKAVIDGFLAIAKQKGIQDAQKVLCRGVMDEHTQEMALRICDSMSKEEIYQTLRSAGFNISVLKRMDD